MRPIVHCLTFLLLTSLLSSACLGQDTPPRDAPPTLAAALAQAAPPAGGLALAVGADKVMPLRDAPPPPGAGATVPQVAAAFGQITQDFGDVTAVAPPTIPLLNPDPHDPNIYDGMKPRDVLTLLVASMDDTQWAALTGKGGLGVGDLTSEDQRRLFAALFPGGKLTIHRAFGTADLVKSYIASAESGSTSKQANQQLDDADKATWRDVSADLPQIRLRLGHVSRILDYLDDPAAPPHLEMVNYDVEQYKSKDTLYGVQVRADVSNTLKEGQLDFDRLALQSPVAVMPWKTVGALIAAVAQASHLEIYADKRWEAKPLSVVSNTQAQPARNLLRALAMCLGGTYRKVGPAYVLTHDLVGVGAIRQRWAEFESDADAVKQTPLTEARNHISAAHSLADLTQPTDPLDPTADQRKLGDAVRSWFPLTFAQLTPNQQGLVRRNMAQRQVWHDRFVSLLPQHPGYKDDFSFGATPTQTGRFTVRVLPQLQLLIPSVQGDVDSGIFLLPSSLFASSPKTAVISGAANPTISGRKDVSLSTALASIPRRAVLAHPRTAAEVDALIVLLQRAHLNALYLDVFSGGVSHLDGSPDILDEALARTKGTGIAVFPIVDLFGWAGEAPGAAPDVNILGETSVQAATRTQAREALIPLAAGATPASRPPGPLFVSPTAPATGQTLLGLVQGLAARPGIAGLVWRDATPPGYAPDAGMDSTGLGYTQADRLAFLRRTHVDPVDLSFSVYTGANLTLPGFDGDAADEKVQAQWQAARAAGHKALLRSLLLAARPLTILVERTELSGTGDDWYGSWDGPNLPLPTFQYAYPTTLPADAQAKATSRLALLTLSPKTLLGPDAGALLQEKFRHTRWDGFVLDANAPRPDAKKAPLPLEEALAVMGR